MDDERARFCGPLFSRSTLTVAGAPSCDILSYEGDDFCLFGILYLRYITVHYPYTHLSSFHMLILVSCCVVFHRTLF